jgi:hypothetical protein
LRGASQVELSGVAYGFARDRRSRARPNAEGCLAKSFVVRSVRKGGGRGRLDGISSAPRADGPASASRGRRYTSSFAACRVCTTSTRSGAGIRRYLDFYHLERLQQALGYQTPDEFHRTLRRAAGCPPALTWHARVMSLPRPPRLRSRPETWPRSWIETSWSRHTDDDGRASAQPGVASLQALIPSSLATNLWALPFFSTGDTQHDREGGPVQRHALSVTFFGACSPSSRPLLAPRRHYQPLSSPCVHGRPRAAHAFAASPSSAAPSPRLSPMRLTPSASLAATEDQTAGALTRVQRPFTLPRTRSSKGGSLELWASTAEMSRQGITEYCAQRPPLSRNEAWLRPGSP